MKKNIVIRGIIKDDDLLKRRWTERLNSRENGCGKSVRADLLGVNSVQDNINIYISYYFIENKFSLILKHTLIKIRNKQSYLPASFSFMTRRMLY